MVTTHLIGKITSGDGSDDNVLVGNQYSGIGATDIRYLGINTTFNQGERIVLRHNASSTADYSSIYAQATTTAALVDIRQFGSGDILNIFDNTTEVFTILDGGNIGVGSSTPSALLSIGNNLNIDASGNLTGGTWLGNAIGVTYGGTGTTTAPSENYMLIGNASGGYDYINSSSVGATTMWNHTFTSESIWTAITGLSTTQSV